MRFAPIHCITVSVLALLSSTTWSAEKPEPVFLAGAVTVDITPQKFPRIIAGGFLEGRGDKVTDRLFARCMVLDDGQTKIAFAIVDTCMMPQSLIDEAKSLASKECGIPVGRMMVSATHTHSAPAAMGCLGTRLDKEYAAILTNKIAEGIVAAAKKLEPARIGWASIDDWEHTHNRRWIRKPEAAVVDPFGEKTGRANMHPGYESPDVIGPSGPVDPGLSVISVQAKDGRPLAVLANYSQHYFGAPAVSADYYGAFCRHVAGMLGQSGEGNRPFVCAISQGTSGDLMWMDYGSPKKTLTLDTYAEAVAKRAVQALKQVKYRDAAPLNMVEKKITLSYRLPDAKRLEWAQRLAKQIENDLPKDKPQVYAREAVILNERQQTTVKLQAIRIGDLTISTLPNEVYAITGLKLKAQSPSAMHFNIELANGAEGYIPPPEQHVLGGYTTWPARTAGLEVQAEPKMVDTLLGALEEATGKPRRAARDEHGPYAQAILEAKPAAYWRMNDFAGRTARNAVAGGAPLTLTDGFAWYLPGVGSGTGTGAGEALTPSAFSGTQQINRAVHLAGGEVQTSLALPGKDYSIALWFWLGEASGASAREGTLISAPGGEVLRCEQDPLHLVRLSPGNPKAIPALYADDWHFAVLVREGDRVKVHVNGNARPEVELDIPRTKKGPLLSFGHGLQGKIDEVAVFQRALDGREIESLWNASGVALQHAASEAERGRRQQALLKDANEEAERAKALALLPPLAFAKGYHEAILDLRPVSSVPGTERMPHFIGGSADLIAFPVAGTRGTPRPVFGAHWSVSLWFRNDVANDANPVTAYLISRGPKGNAKAPGDHLGIGGTYKNQYTGKLIVFNGNEANQVVAGPTVIASGTWNHVVLARDGERVRAWLNGGDKPEIDAELPITVTGVETVWIGRRSDNFAPLNGAIAECALFDRSLTTAEAKKLHTASGQPVGAPKAAATAPPAKLELASLPLSPEESLKKWHVREGYRIELAAAEPVVLDPVAFDWDDKGRLWVVEMADYPMGMDGNGKPGGRVVMLEDTNADARYDKRTVIAEGLNFPTGILTWRDGALVTAAPDLLYIGPTGEKKVLLTGFSTGNQQLRVNGLRWGMDGWVYCAAGAHNVGYNKGTEITSVLTGEKITLGSRDFRFKPDTGEFDPQSGPSQFGRTRDDWGHWFGVQNSFPLWHYVLQDHYLRRNPHVIPPDPIHQLFPRNPRVYPVSSMEKRFHSFGESGRFTSACGIEVYRDRVLFDDGKTHAFTCEPFHNVVQHHVLEDDGVTFKATRDPAEAKHDFLASEDRWCRPVMVRTGPDGALWVADMYRYMIEHPQWLPQNGKEELLPHYREGDDKGRIWRVVRGQGSADTPVRSITANLKKTDKSVHATFESQNGWMRDRAQMMLLWNNDQEAVEYLDQVIAGDKQPEARSRMVRAQAGWTLLTLGKLKTKTCLQLLRDESPRVREQALMMAERLDWKDGAPVLHEVLSKLVEDKDAKVRLQLACSLGAWQDAAAEKVMVRLLKQDGHDPVMLGAILCSASGRLAGLTQDAPDAALLPLAGMAVQAWDEPALLNLTARMTIKDKSAVNVVPRLRMLHGLLLAAQSHGMTIRDMLRKARSPELTGHLREFMDIHVAAAMDVVWEWADSPLAKPEDFIAMAEIPLLSPGHETVGYQTLNAWMRDRRPILPQTAAQVLGRHPKAEMDDLMMAMLATATPSLKQAIVEALLSRESGALLLLTGIKNGKLKTSGLMDTATQSRLMNHPKPAVKNLATAVLAKSGTATRTTVLEKFKPALKLKGEPGNGKLVFSQICISCHKLDDVGLELGPDLRSVAQHDGEKLLNSILDPSAIIEPGFMAYHCTLKNGEQLYGVIATETSTSLTLKLPGNVTRSVLRSEVVSLKSTNTSLMPDGLEAVMTPQSLADLMAYLKQAR